MNSAFLRDYSRWVKFSWTPVQAAMLTVDEFPLTVDENYQPEIPSQKMERYKWIMFLITNAISQGKLEALIEPRAFLEWAKTYNVTLPEKLIKCIRPTSKDAKLEKRERSSYLNTIGALKELMLGQKNDSKRNSIYHNQTAIIQAILEKYPNSYGLSQRALEDKFSAASRSLEASK